MVLFFILVFTVVFVSSAQENEGLGNDQKDGGGKDGPTGKRRDDLEAHEMNEFLLVSSQSTVVSHGNGDEQTRYRSVSRKRGENSTIM